MYVFGILCQLINLKTVRTASNYNEAIQLLFLGWTYRCLRMYLTQLLGGFFEFILDKGSLQVLQ